ncbi:isocitrate lyase/PEP mutase family protein [Jidongwangia harbinensis]|uniref:isocitrate lyase/PEP mutase family protein n=1 Tax=Jidongwangia harbinensis TaxID=2878561 RepID=UPI001CD931E3|nr:isocitrate lyase/phosphoenolpyruvate mutase family protein [Jidongwangia harbinensis]MCA2216190.1 isocitrate lyase/phosphoenolpyruvate mutase family protein [Jidongwangia harbinensis]
MTDFRSLHVPGKPLVLVNAWDVASARIVEAAGAAAVATTSAGVAWSLGAPDGDALDRESAVAAVSRICAAVTVPVTADIESGYGAVADTVGRVVAAGAAGINLEDGRCTVEEQRARIAEARRAGGALFVNARIDTFLFGTGGLDETVHRAEVYLRAGADGVFVPGVTDPATIRELVARIPAPVNVMVGPGAPPVADLAALGVARISFGSSVAQAAYGLVARVARELAVPAGADYGTLNGLVSRPGT